MFFRLSCCICNLIGFEYLQIRRYKYYTPTLPGVLSTFLAPCPNLVMALMRHRKSQCFCQVLACYEFLYALHVIMHMRSMFIMLLQMQCPIGNGGGGACPLEATFWRPPFGCSSMTISRAKYISPTATGPLKRFLELSCA